MGACWLAGDARGRTEAVVKEGVPYCTVPAGESPVGVIAQAARGFLHLQRLVERAQPARGEGEQLSGDRLLGVLRRIRSRMICRSAAVPRGNTRRLSRWGMETSRSSSPSCLTAHSWSHGSITHDAARAWPHRAIGEGAVRHLHPGGCGAFASCATSRSRPQSERSSGFHSSRAESPGARDRRFWPIRLPVRPRVRPLTEKRVVTDVTLAEVDDRQLARGIGGWQPDLQ